MAMCTEGKTTSAFEHVTCSEMNCLSSAGNMDTFVPSMIAMLTDAYPSEMENYAEDCDKFLNIEASGTSPVERLRASVEEIEDNNITKLHRNKKLNQVPSSRHYYGSSNEKEKIENLVHNSGKCGDVMLSQKSLPDINFFVNHPSEISRRLGNAESMEVDENGETDFTNSRNNSHDSLASLCIDTTASDYGSHSEDEKSHSPVFTDLTVNTTCYSGEWRPHNPHNCYYDKDTQMYPSFSESRDQQFLTVKQERLETENNGVHYCSRSPTEQYFEVFRRVSQSSSNDGHFHTPIECRHPAMSSSAPEYIGKSEYQNETFCPEFKRVESYNGDYMLNQKNEHSDFYGIKSENSHQCQSLPKSTENEPCYAAPVEIPRYFHVNAISNPMNVYSTSKNGHKRENQVFDSAERQEHISCSDEHFDGNLNGVKKFETSDFDCFSSDAISCLELENIVGPCMEEMKGIILKEVVKDVDIACSTLELSSDPELWSEDQVEKWVNWTINQYNLPVFDASLFRMNGSQLCALSETQMCSIAPKSGNFLHAHLEIWRTVVEPKRRGIENDLSNDGDTNMNHVLGTTENNSHVVTTNRPSADFLSETDRVNKFQTAPDRYSRFESINGEHILNMVQRNECSVTVMTPNHTAGIHLWQFLKELLLQPNLYGQYIRWIEKEHGIFKIEDSVEVARLWGIRKNRPAMNYDKLSRSIRQYYKKGIIKKTEVSQRLVYQFVKPVV